MTSRSKGMQCTPGTSSCAQSDYIKSLESDKERLIENHEKTKKFWRRVAKVLIMTLAVVSGLLILTLIFGAEEAAKTVLEWLPF